MHSRGSLAPACAQQVLCALAELRTAAGIARVARVQQLSAQFRSRLRAAGMLVLGDACSPVVPVLLGMPSKIAAVSRMCLARHLAIVVVGFPATPLLEPRARFCISASHTQQDVDFAIEVLVDVAHQCHLRYRTHALG